MPRLAGAITALAALAALGMAYFAQYGLHLTPCELCLWERWPYRLVAGLGLLAAFAKPKTSRALLALAGLAMLGDAGIAFLHVGVERGWWASPLPQCNGALIPGAPLPPIPATPCDRPVYLVPALPISMAMLDLAAALVFAIALGCTLMRGRSLADGR
jgi:disulfide bond formation protein DsbB